MKMTVFIYALSVAGYPDIYKIGTTDITPNYMVEIMNKKENMTNKYKLWFAKEVKDLNATQKIFNILDKCGSRLENNYFKIELHIVRDLFDLVQGEYFNFVPPDLAHMFTN